MAVIVALGLRSCLYEPFKIPSPSMVPTLVPGDHIFVNKFRYGVQIPFTTTIVAEDAVSGIERGEVVVFRYPLDPEQDYIKRVIGLPGDELKIKDESIAIKRPGESEYVKVERRRLSEPCPDDFGQGAVENCVLFEETLDGHSYIVRIDRNAAGATRGQYKFYRVPEGHLMVMGDNRRHSADSLQWSQRVEAVFADKLITDKDLRDTTQSRIFRDERGDTYSTDADIDEVTYVAERNSKAHDMELQVWRSPSLGARAVFAAASAGLEPSTLSELAHQQPDELTKGTLERIDDASGRLRGLAVKRSEDAWISASWMRGADGETPVVTKLSCGVEVCPTAGHFARELLSIVDAVDADEQRPAKELMRRPGGFTYTSKWLGREGIDARFFDKSFQLAGSSGGKDRALRVRAWRQPSEGSDLVWGSLQAAFGEGRVVESTGVEGTKAFVADDEMRVVEADQGFAVYGRVAEQRVLFAMECGSQHCTNEAKAIALASQLAERAARAATEAKMLERLARREWLESQLPEHLQAKWTAGPSLQALDEYEWDNLGLMSRIRDVSQYARIHVERHTPETLMDALEKKRQALQGASDVEFLQGFEVADPGLHNGYVHVFVEPSTQVLVRVTCAEQLCDGIEGARELAKRAANKAKDTRNFVDPAFMLDTPYVPRGNVKGRAERIWAKSPEAGSVLPYRLSFDEIR